MFKIFIEFLPYLQYKKKCELKTKEKFKILFFLYFIFPLSSIIFYLKIFM